MFWSKNRRISKIRDFWLQMYFSSYHHMVCIYSSLKLTDWQPQYQLLSKVILVDSCCFTKLILVRLWEFPINIYYTIRKWEKQILIQNLLLLLLRMNWHSSFFHQYTLVKESVEFGISSGVFTKISNSLIEND